MFDPALLAFLAYLAVVVGIGVYATGFSSAGTSEFFVGGRRMHHWVVALSAVASGRSAWLLLGFTGLAYTRGASAVWAAVGYTVVEAVLFLTVAPRLRRFSETWDCVTVPDFFAERLGERRGWLRALLVLVLLAFLVGYVGAQLLAGGKALSSSFPVTEPVGVGITAAVVLAYTLLGGFLAVSLTDVVQAGVMVLALLGLPLLLVEDLGGAAVVAETLRALDPALLDPGAIALGAAFGFVAIGLGSPGSPHILARYISVEDPAQLRTSAVVGTAWNVLMAGGALAIGLLGRASFPDVQALPNADPENVYLMLAQQALPPALFGLVLASVFAAIMSTSDSQLLVAASSVVRDLVEKVIAVANPPPQRRLVTWSRITVALLVGASVLLATRAEALIFWLVLLSWAGLGASIGPTLLLALYWRRTTAAGAAAGLLAGALTTLVWAWIPALDALVYELVPGFAAGLVATVLVSLLTRPPDDVPRMFAVMADRR